MLVNFHWFTNCTSVERVRQCGSVPQIVYTRRAICDWLIVELLLLSVVSFDRTRIGYSIYIMHADDVAGYCNWSNDIESDLCFHSLGWIEIDEWPTHANCHSRCGWDRVSPSHILSLNVKPSIPLCLRFSLSIQICRLRHWPCTINRTISFAFVLHYFNTYVWYICWLIPYGVMVYLWTHRPIEHADCWIDEWPHVLLLHTLLKPLKTTSFHTFDYY